MDRGHGDEHRIDKCVSGRPFCQFNVNQGEILAEITGHFIFRLVIERTGTVSS